ncbi:MAG: type II CAAX prenyl endopeptidase Rce1 family protein [Sphingobacteriia bacterium]
MERQEEKPFRPGYFQLVRRNSYNFIFAGKLLVLYELSQLLLSGELQVTNAIDSLFKQAFAAIPQGTLYVSLGLLLIGLFVLAQDHRQGYKIRLGVFGWMWAESLLWALVVFFNLSLLVRYLPLNMSLAVGTNGLLPMLAGSGITYAQKLSLSLGAGFYEELFFRLILVKLILLGLVFAGMRRDGLGTQFLVVLITAILFSLAHFQFVIGGAGDAWGWYPFFYRAAFGVIMSLLLLLRGFGITAWTHALYDILVFTLV